MSNLSRTPLPIDPHLEEIVAKLSHSNCLVIEAPPGTGKTTRAAPALLPLAAELLRGLCGERLRAGEPSRGGKVLLLQPRRIAARAAAARIADEMQQPLGQLVGYQVRFDSRTSGASRLIAMTPGILLRKLQSDAVLADVAIVVLDEFHERSLEYDLILGMLRRIQIELRPELRLVIMSATLDRQTVLSYLGDPPVVSVVAQTYPVRLLHNRFQAPVARGQSPPNPRARMAEQVAEATRSAASEYEGDILVFLPGVGEIMLTQMRLERDAEKYGWKLLTLFGDMSPQEQDRVLSSYPNRKVILSTNVAETSLTIDGVRVVIDSGLARVQRIDPAVGLNMLALEPISKASAAQRAGRAGRTAPGVCLRMWDEITGRSRAEFLEPEVLRVELSGAVLQLLCWGEADTRLFPWITPPSESAVDQAHEALRMIGAVDERQVTALGKDINKLPVQPRLARLLIEGHRLGITSSAALAAACLSERDVFDRRHRQTTLESSMASQQHHECDVTRQVLQLLRYRETGATESDLGTIKVGAARNLLRIAQQLQDIVIDELGSAGDLPLNTAERESLLQRALLAAFPDRLARRREAGSARGLMVGGRGVKLESTSLAQKCEFFLCLDVDAAGIEAKVRNASAIDPSWLPAEHLCRRDERFFNPTQNAVVTRRRAFFLDLMLSETPVETLADEQTARLLSRAAAEQFQRMLPAKDKLLHSWLARVRWLAREVPEAPLPSFDVEPLADTLSGWCYGMRKLDELKQLPWRSLLDSLLTPEGRRMLDAQAPESLALPTGRRVLLEYELGKPPVLAARIQEFFGWSETPRLAGGRIRLVLHMLAPNGRIQQITDDLASFWANTYPIVRRELRGRYPKHAWPESPQA